MCRLFSMTSSEPVSPIRAVEALNVMKEGHDGSGVGLFLRGLDGPFAETRENPILSGIFTPKGLAELDSYMHDKGFVAGHTLMINKTVPPPVGIPKRDTYLMRSYELPKAWANFTQLERELGMVQTRLDLRHMGLESQDLLVHSFWPDTIMLKEVGDPLTVGKYLRLDRKELFAQRILAQGRQNTNYAINLYACHPFFIQGICTMTNGENTAFVPIREYLQSRGVLGYEGYNSDSEVFTHILHYTLTQLKLPLEAYKHVMTPLFDAELEDHPDKELLKRLKQLCRKLVIDGPNCVIGCLPDGTMFMAQDRKKLRPGVVGGKPGIFAFSSEICGLDAAIPDRDKTKDFQPMYLDTAIVDPECQEVRICRQDDPLHLHP